MRIVVDGDLLELTEEQVEMFEGLTTLRRNVALKKLTGLSDVEAYRQGGGKAKSLTSQTSSAADILTNPDVRAFIDSFNGYLVSKSIMGRQEMLQRLTAMARTDMTDLVDIKNRVVVEDPEMGVIEQSFWALKDVDEMDADSRAAISELTATRGELKIKIHDQKAAMKQIAEIEGFNAPIEHDVIVAPKGFNDFYSNEDANDSTEET